MKKHAIVFIVKNKILKFLFETEDFKKASEVYEHKEKSQKKGKWQLICQVN